MLIQYLSYIIILLPSVDKGTHASKRDNFGIFCVIIIRCTSSTPQSSALKMPKCSPLEVEESGRDKFCALQGIWTTRTGRTRSENNAAESKIYSALTVYPLVNWRYTFAILIANTCAVSIYSLSFHSKSAIAASLANINSNPCKIVPAAANSGAL